MKECNHPTCGDVCRRQKPARKLYKLKRTPVKKTSRKKTKILGERKVESAKDREFFQSIWEEREHFCFETGDYLGEEPLTLFFHHVLKRRLKRFEKYRYCNWNIILLRWDKHTNADNYMRATVKVKAYYEYLIKHLDEIESGKYKPSFKKFENETV